jgi:AcrR family transcriptional regulator
MATARKVAGAKALATKSGRTRGRPRPDAATAIEAELLAVALREFLQHGYGGTSMSQIVKAARVSKTTLYSRYPSKEVLFRAIITAQIDEMSPTASLQPASGSPDLERGLKSFANQMLEASLQGDLLGVNRLILSEAYRFPELGLAAAERTAMGIRRIAEFIRECAAADGLPCRDPEGVAEAFILMIRGWYVNVLQTNTTASSAERQRWVDRAVHALLSARQDW